MNGPREYKHPAFQTVIAIILFGILLFGIIVSLGQEDSGFALLPLAAGIFLFMVFAVISMSTKTIISDEEITTKTLLGTKTLRWNEISRTSGRGYSIKLHNFDGDLTIAPSPNLNGYEEVVEWIGTKRPDLFASQEYNELRRGWENLIGIGIFLLIFLGLCAFLGFSMLQSQNNLENMLFPILFFLFIMGILAWTSLASPQYLSMQGKTLYIKYIFGEKTFTADEVASIGLTHTQTRNGKNYFIVLNLTNRKTIRLSGLAPNLPTAYLALKNWFGQNR